MDFVQGSFFLTVLTQIFLSAKQQRKKKVPEQFPPKKVQMLTFGALMGFTILSDTGNSKKKTTLYVNVLVRFINFEMKSKSILFQVESNFFG